MSGQCFLGAQLRKTGSLHGKNGRLLLMFPAGSVVSGALEGGFVRTWDWDFRISLFLCSLNFFLEGVTCLLRSLVSQFVV